jgi:hypothetical protein
MGERCSQTIATIYAADGDFPDACAPLKQNPEPVFLNFYGAQESIPWNRFRQPIAWRVGMTTLFLLGS